MSAREFPSTISGHSKTLMEAVATVLNAAVAAWVPVAERSQTGRTARFLAEVREHDALPGALLESIVGIVRDLDATPIRAHLEGLRPMADGNRAWGLLEIDEDDPCPAPAPRVIGLSRIHELPGGYLIEIDVEWT